MWARRADIDLLLAETTVAVGIEVELETARKLIEAVDKLVDSFVDGDDDPDRLVDMVLELTGPYLGRPADSN